MSTGTVIILKQTAIDIGRIRVSTGTVIILKQTAIDIGRISVNGYCDYSKTNCH